MLFDLPDIFSLSDEESEKTSESVLTSSALLRVISWIVWCSTLVGDFDWLAWVTSFFWFWVDIGFIVFWGAVFWSPDISSSLNLSS